MDDSGQEGRARGRRVHGSVKQKAPLPAIRVKLSSQAADTASTAQAVVRDLTARRWIEKSLTVTGKMSRQSERSCGAECS